MAISDVFLPGKESNKKTPVQLGTTYFSAIFSREFVNAYYMFKCYQRFSILHFASLAGWWVVGVINHQDVNLVLGKTLRVTSPFRCNKQPFNAVAAQEA